MMRRPLLGLSAILALASGCSTPAPPLLQRPSPEAVAAVAQACASLDEVDLARFAPVEPDWRPFERFHAMARLGLEPFPASSSSIILKLAIPGGSIAAPYGTSVFAAQQPDGRWLVSHVRIRQLDPPPQPPGAPPLAAGPERIVTTGVLSRAAVDRIDAAIGSECYRREPLVSPASLPLRDGTTAHCPPDGGQANAIEIWQNGNSRRYLRECGRPWAIGVIIMAIEDVRNIVPGPLPRT